MLRTERWLKRLSGKGSAGVPPAAVGILPNVSSSILVT
jgi:hypothetical protein